VERLLSLGYLSGSVPASETAGVTIYEPEEAWEGLSFFTSGHGPVAILADMNGRVLHTWEYDFWDVWPDFDVPKNNIDTQFWRRAYLFENGDVLAIYDWLGMIKIDKDSNLLWAHPGLCHHDLYVAHDGRIHVLEQEAHVVPRIHRTKPILEDFIAILSPSGEVVRRFSLLEAFEQSAYAPMLKRMPKSGDIMHTNTIEVLDGQLGEISPAFKTGNVLVCLKSIETIAVVDMDTEKVVWALAGRWSMQHQPTVLPNSHMLLFNNKAGDNMSEVIEFDPFTQETVWSYRGDDERPFYSAACGSNQRLQNGNTLITESYNVRAFEVTPDKRIVWEFVNPYRAGENDEFIATLFELVRLAPDFPHGWAKGAVHGDKQPETDEPGSSR
jgi:hypothetical protein